MRYILIILLLITQFAAAQNLRKWSSDSTTNTAWGNWLYRLHPTYTAGTGDTLKLADYKLVKDSAVFNIFRTAGKDSIFFTRGGQTFAIKDSAGTANAWALGGNSPATIATLGTNDNNAFDIELNNVVKHRFHVDGTLSINSTTDQTALLYVNGRSRFTQLLEIENGVGFSALSGAQMNNFGALAPANSINWVLNNIYQNVNTSKNFFRIGADVETSAATTQTVNQLILNPVYNNTNGTSTLRGFYYNPTLTAVTGTTNIAFENSSGLWVMRTLRTGFGTYSLLVHLADSSVAQIPSTTFTTPAQVATQIHDSLGATTTVARSPLFPYEGAGSDPDTLAILGLNGLGTAGQSIRINAGATGFEYYTPSAGGITSINSETGAAITLAGSNGLTAATTTNTVTYTLGGALTGATNITGGGSFPISLGTSGSKLSNFAINSADDINLNPDDRIGLNGGVQHKLSLASDADFTITTNMHSIWLGTITADRTLTLPTLQPGMVFIVHNENSAGFAWNVSGTLQDKNNAAVTALANDTVYVIQGIDNGTTTYWKIVSIY